MFNYYVNYIKIFLSFKRKSTWCIFCLGEQGHCPNVKILIIILEKSNLNSFTVIYFIFFSILVELCLTMRKMLPCVYKIVYVEHHVALSKAKCV